MSLNTTKQQRHALREANKHYSSTLEPIPFDRWPTPTPYGLKNVYRSNRYLVQVYMEFRHGVDYRVTISRTDIDGGRWKDGISWEELQGIKDSIGFADHDAVEVFPVRRDVVNVANMRHLWIMSSPLLFAWRKQEKEHGQP